MASSDQMPARTRCSERPITERPLSFWVARIRKALRREFECRTGELAISMTQYQVLRRLWDGDGILTSQLTADICSDGGTITGVLDRMEARGLILRVRNTTDRRAVEIRLTTEGRELETPLRQIWAQTNEHALTGFSTEEREQLMYGLERVRQNIGA